MMEGFGVVASVTGVVSLSLQLAEKVQNLHDFWDSCRYASEDVQDIVLDLQLFRDVLERSYRSYNEEDAVLLKILSQCYRKIVKLENLVKKMTDGFSSESFAKRKWTAVKAMLNKDNIEDFRQSLRETKIDLHLLNKAIAE